MAVRSESGMRQHRQYQADDTDKDAGYDKRSFHIYRSVNRLFAVSNCDTKVPPKHAK
jgi:hypothetical protein